MKHMSEEKEFEKKIMEAIEKEEKAKVSSSSSTGKNPKNNPAGKAGSENIEEKLREALSEALGNIARVEVKLVDSELTVTIITNDEFKKCVTSEEPIVYKFKLADYDMAKLRSTKTFKDFVTTIMNRYMLGYFKPQFLTTFGLEYTTLKIGRERAISLIAYFAQKGSALHCTILYNALSHLIKQTLKEHDPSVKKYILDCIIHARFPLLAQFLQCYYPSNPEVASIIESYLSETVKAILSKYAKVSYDVSYISDAEIEKTKKLVFESCDKLDIELIPEDFDEEKLIELLHRLSKIYPEIKNCIPEPPKKVKVTIEEQEKPTEEDKTVEYYKKIIREMLTRYS